MTVNHILIQIGLLHRLWEKAKVVDGYIESEWQDLGRRYEGGVRAEDLLGSDDDERLYEDLSDHEMLHRLWTKAVGEEGYDKQEWKALEKRLGRKERKR